MQQSLTITIDQRNVVFYAGMSLGTGEDTFLGALDEVPVSRVEKIVVRDERDPQAAKKWVFYHPHEFESLRDAIEYFPTEGYTVTEWEQQELRQEESVYIEPDLLSVVESSVNKPDYLPKPRPAKPVVEPEPEPEPVIEEEPQEVQVEAQPEVEEDVPEPEEPVKPKEKHVRPEEAEDIDWTPSSKMERFLSEGSDDETDLFRPYVDTAAVEKLPKGVSDKQAYLPGERLDVIPIAERKARFTVNKQRSKTPLYILGLLALIIGGFFLVNNVGITPAAQYTAVCIDSRTQLVAAGDECKSGQSGRTVVYIPSEDATGLTELGPIPETAEFERPDGNVEISEL